jgi:uncharacterized protein
MNRRIGKVGLAVALFLSAECMFGELRVPVDLVKQFPSESDARLVSAVLEGDTQGVNDAIAAGGNMNCVGTGGSYPLYWAVAIRAEEVAATLLRAGADIDLATQDYGTALAAAALDRNPRMVRFLLESGADPNGPSPSGRRALHDAAMIGEISSVVALLHYGADVDLKDPGQPTPLLIAAAMGNFHVAFTLLRNGASLEARDARGDDFATLLKRRPLPVGHREFVWRRRCIERIETDRRTSDVRE